MSEVEVLRTELADIEQKLASARNAAEGADAGEREKSETYLRRILAELPSSPYAERASAKLGDWSDRRPLNCQTCH